MFESRGGSASVRTREAATAEALIFAQRLGVPEVLARQSDELIDYAVDVHMNIAWYVRRLEREKLWRQVFTISSLALLPLIPALIWLLGAAPGEGGALTVEADSGISAAQLTAMLTGVLAIHKTVAAWLDKRQLFGHFWRASADLKEILYSCEQSWKDEAHADGALRPEFLEALQADLVRVRQILREERQGFYDLYRYPSFDVVHKLTEAFSQSRTLVNDLRSPAQRDRDERALSRKETQAQVVAAKRRLNEIDAQVAGLKALEQEREAQLEGADERTRLRIEQSLSQIYQSLDQARHERIKVDAELAALAG